MWYVDKKKLAPRGTTFVRLVRYTSSGDSGSIHHYAMGFLRYERHGEAVQDVRSSQPTDDRSYALGIVDDGALVATEAEHRRAQERYQAWVDAARQWRDE